MSWGINALQVSGNSEYHAECGVQYYGILRLQQLTQAQSNSDQHPTGKKAVELCCSPCGVVLYGGCSDEIPAFPECFNASCHYAIYQRCIATCFTRSLKTFLCTMTSCHFNFDSGTLLYFCMINKEIYKECIILLLNFIFYFPLYTQLVSVFHKPSSGVFL